ncbi:MAG TPA: hypothetical protein PKC49_02650 [Phycisphaerae bacterium]|nr:hypothetical protein [Phycisphaerae bacterium]
MKRVLDVLLARREADDWAAAAAQHVLAGLWHLWPLAVFGLYGVAAEEPLAAIGPTSGMVVLSVVGRVAFSIGVRRGARRRGLSESRLYARAWWRTCLWTSASASMWALIFPSDFNASRAPGYELCALTIVLGLLAGPVVFGRQDARLPRLRWRPQCPECGYSIFRATTAGRCPECGAPYPSPLRHNRRWAIRRHPWDRRPRDFVVTAYLKSVVLNALCPCRAAWRLGSPDRFGRALRWAAAHVLLAALLAALLGSRGYHLDAIVTFVQDSCRGEPPSAAILGQSALHAAHSLAAWLCVLVAILATGLALAWIPPARLPHAPAALVKWTLYATSTLVPAVVIAWLIANGGLPPNAWSTRPGRWALGAAAADPTVVALLAAAWWSRGAAAGPQQAWRGMPAAGLFFVAYTLAWRGVTLLFPSGALGVLL